MEESAGGVAYTFAVSAVASLTGLVTGEDFSRLTVTGALSGALFLLMWIWLAFETGRWPHQRGQIALLGYWVALPVLVLLLDLLAAQGAGGATAVLRGVSGGLLFSSNYVLSWLFGGLLGVSAWWGTVMAATLLMGAWLMGDSWNRRGVGRQR